jgi:hypothetical protein
MLIIHVKLVRLCRHYGCDQIIIMNTTNEMQLYRLIYYSLSALHVSGDVFAYNQEHLTIFTVSSSIQRN